MFGDQLHQTHAFDMCHYYDKSNVTIMMSSMQLDANQEVEEYAYMVPSKLLCNFVCFY